MVVAIQSYSLAPGWTGTQVADTFRQMFIDAGLMNDWHDSFSATVDYVGRGRVLRLTVDGSKTYGYQYHWFSFLESTGNVSFYYSPVSGWNTSTHLPTGTYLKDYLGNLTGRASGLKLMSSWTTTSSITLTRYTGTGGSYFFMGSTPIALIVNSVGVLPSWIDLDKHAVSSVYSVSLLNSGDTGAKTIKFGWLRRLPRYPFNSPTIDDSYSPRWDTVVLGGYYTVDGLALDSDPSGGAIRLPIFKAGRHPSYSSNYSPIITGLNLFPPFEMYLPTDFGVGAVFGAALVVGDTITVTAQEVWTVIQSATSAASTVFIAVRTT